MLCDYGCGLPFSFVYGNGKKCCSKSFNGCPAKASLAGAKRKGVPRPEGIIGKMAAARKGKPSWNAGLTKETDERLKHLSELAMNRKHTEETKNKIRNIKKGKRPPMMDQYTLEEWGAKFSGENNGMFGKTHSIEAKQKISEANIARDSWVGENNPWYGKKRSGDLSPRWDGSFDRRGYKDYKNKVCWLTELVYREYIDIINPFGLQRKQSGMDGGFQLDHIVPIREAFKWKIKPEWIADKENLQIITWEENIKKHAKLTDETRELLTQMLIKQATMAELTQIGKPSGL